MFLSIECTIDIKVVYCNASFVANNQVVFNIKGNYSFDTTPAFLYNPPMFTHQLLQSMCADISDADLLAIRKTRGFSVGETAARNSFASFFVSSIGVQEAMQSLTAEESVTLGLLHQPAKFTPTPRVTITLIP